MKTRTLLLMCGLSLAGTPAATVGPVGDNHGAARPPVLVRDAGGGTFEIEAHDASVHQILAVLEESGFIRLSASDPLSRTVSGTYTGTLPQVLSRILDGYDYFLRVTSFGTEVHALNASSDKESASRSGSGGTNAALPSGSSDHTAALQSGAGSKVDAAAPPAPAPVAAFSLSAPNPVSKARARARAQQSAKAH